MPNNNSRLEKIAVGLIIAAVLLISLVPVIKGYLETPGGQHFFGSSFIIAADYPVYLSEIEQARQGHWLMANLYTTEPQKSILFSPLWLVLGFLAGIIGGSNILWFYLGKILFGALFLAFLYRFVSHWFADRFSRLVCFILLTFSSGLGILLIPKDRVWDVYTVFFNLPIDLWVAEANTFLTVYYSALFSLSQLLIVAIFYIFLKTEKHFRFLQLLGLTFILGILHPYDLITVAAVPLVYIIVEAVRQRKILKEQINAYVAIIAGALPAGLYYVLITKIDPAIGGWAKQNITVTPPLFSFIFGYGLVLFFAILGTILIIRRREEKFYFIITWAATAIVLLYLPISFSRRFFNGLHIPLVMLAAFALVRLWPRVKKYWFLVCLTPPLLVLGFFMTNSLVITQDATSKYQKDFPNVISDNYYQAFSWIKDNSPVDSAILSGVRVAGILPAFTGRKVFAGHGHQTIDFFAWKKTLVENWFFRDNKEDQQKAQFLIQNNISYLWYSDLEKKLGSFNPQEKSYLEKVYSNAEVEIYRVK